MATPTLQIPQALTNAGTDTLIARAGDHGLIACEELRLRLGWSRSQLELAMFYGGCLSKLARAETNTGHFLFRRAEAMKACAPPPPKKRLDVMHEHIRRQLKVPGRKAKR